MKSLTWSLRMDSLTNSIAAFSYTLSGFCQAHLAIRSICFVFTSIPLYWCTSWCSCNGRIMNLRIFAYFMAHLKISYCNVHPAKPPPKHVFEKHSVIHRQSKTKIIWSNMQQFISILTFARTFSITFLLYPFTFSKTRISI